MTGFQVPGVVRWNLSDWTHVSLIRLLQYPFDRGPERSASSKKLEVLRAEDREDMVETFVVICCGLQVAHSYSFETHWHWRTASLQLTDLSMIEKQPPPM